MRRWCTALSKFSKDHSSIEDGERCGGMAQINYTRISKFKNDKIKLKQINKMTVKNKTSSKKKW
jgi:hypothetical protein